MSPPTENNDAPASVDIGKQQIAAVYAKAMLGAADPEQRQSAVDELGEVIRECLDRFPRLDSVLSSPRIKADEKQAMLDRIFGGVSATS